MYIEASYTGLIFSIDIGIKYVVIYSREVDRCNM